MAQCTAKSKRSGVRCRRASVPGLEVCPSHGGKAPKAQAAAARRVAEAEIRTRFMPHEIAPCENPMEALAQLAGEVLKWRDVMREQLNELALLTTEDDIGVERAKAIVELYERSLDRAERTLVNIGRLKLDERLVKLSEAQAAMVIEAMEATLADKALGLDAKAQEAGLATAGRHLRALRAA